ncbi:MAG TPA: MgtC/SapB family protein [Pseudonocardia sp.]|jgi:putative Mg2+ transporter-C (MgtC) family protein|nr:MgtC/SapB family protein [Pseudonocardia sp.]
MESLLGEPTGQGWLQLFELAVALVLSALIGLERELRQKSAGLRTHALIGFSSALIVLVSKYGFTDVLSEHTALDPSRVAAQIVSGIGFIGGGLIFVKRDLVRGLTTAAAVWLTTAVGMAAGAGLPVLAVATTVGYFAIAYGFTPLTSRLRRAQPRSRYLEVIYEDGRGLLRQILHTCTARGWVMGRLGTRHLESSIGFGEAGLVGPDRVHNAVSVVVGLSGTADYEDLVAALTELDGVLAVSATNPDDETDPEFE